MGDVAVNNDHILVIKDLTKTFADQGQSESVLEHLDLQIAEREFLCILGPSGCGKTTLLRCIAGFEKYEGSIYVNGEERRTPGTDRIMVFQDFNQLFPWKTVEKNIQYPLRLSGVRDKAELKRMSDAALEKVQLTAYAKYYPYQLSGGMKARVAIAKALALKPKIILMDEPFAALDAMTRRALQNELLRITAQETSTFVFITHNIQEAIVLGKRILVLSKGGRIVYDRKNTLPQPITPASPGYGELWQQLRDALYINDK
jgi:NitT/TauT family transport system ATP-binding protein